jgi:hypothetical protein
MNDESLNQENEQKNNQTNEIDSSNIEMIM